jgi:uncharacterized protein
MKITTKQDFFEAIQQHRQQLKQTGISKLGLFGSFARNEANEKSDVDVLVGFHSEQKTYDNLFTLHELLQKITGRKVEIVTTKSLSPFIGHHILKSVEYVSI